MHSTEVARGDQVVDVYIPQRRAVLRFVLAEQVLEAPERRHFGAVQTKAARHLSDVAATMSCMHRIDAIGAELVRFGAITAIVDDADQQLDALALNGLQLLDVLVKAAKIG